MARISVKRKSVKKAKRSSARKPATISEKRKKAIRSGYDRFKFFGDSQYTGVKIGRGHKWYYDKGEWHDKKITPDLWEIDYSVTKRRAGKAPEGSGAPVGTEYHWYIFADQVVKKLNANDYSTELKGYKYKLAHKRSDKNKWNVSDKAQRKRLIRFFREMIARLEAEEDEPKSKPEIKEKDKRTANRPVSSGSKRKGGPKKKSAVL